MLAHIAGIPVEETALGFAPVFAVAGTLAAMRLRQLASLLPPHGARTARRVGAGEAQ